MKNLKLTKQEKIILVLFRLSASKKKNIKFEDIAVSLFKKFPKDFHLKGYDKYPDSGDSVKRALYTLREKGYLLVNNMIFTLTDKGLYFGEKLTTRSKGTKITEKDNLDRYFLNEINRVKKIEGFKFFQKKEENKVLDTDFYSYLGISVRSERGEFLSRLKTMNDLIVALEKNAKKDKLYIEIINYHRFIMNKFKELIKYHKED